MRESAHYEWAVTDDQEIRRIATRAYIEAAAQAVDLDYTNLARRAGLAPSTLNRFMNSETSHILGLRTLRAVAEASGVPVPLAVLDPTAPLTSPAPTAPRAPESIITARPVELPPLHTMPRNVPVYGVAAGNGDVSSGDFQLEAGAVIDYVPRPPGLTSTRDAYALYVTGDSMEPKFEHGELVYISPSKPVRPSDYVILCLRGSAPGEPERCFIKRLVRRHPDRVEVRQFNPDKIIAFPIAAIARIHRVLTLADLFGAM